MLVLGIAALIGIVSLCVWLVAEALRNGIVRVRGGSYLRSDDPAWFWLMIATYVTMAGMVIYTVVYMLLPWEWFH